MKKNTIGSLTWLRIVRFTHQSNLLSNEFLKQYDLTTAQFDVLVQISAYGPLTQSELAEKVTVTQGGISRMLARLEKDRLIERQQEWKTKTIYLTQKGQEKLDRAFKAQLAFQSSFFEESLTKEEQKTLLSLMSKVQKNTEKKLSTR
ncbi:MarR family transcriptional regulator [Ornithinibacillus gellani]|uniref:MarR family winged helix-turn-helix transcriptional regulator n=1 Tax=Ornithinibacillus gellani TaxID=2293253 RepID=UPI000F46635F|nr:MarR family transcriptional regulator [Ornithinibacillus gellani]TQS71862.1 MarR family transcriptional regulator [Ornithinibacillus gellani]